MVSVEKRNGEGVRRERRVEEERSIVRGDRRGEIFLWHDMLET